MGGSLGKAFVLYRQRRYDLAQQELAREFQANPGNAQAYALLAMCLSFQGRFRDARAAAEQAIKLSPGLAYAHSSLASVYHFDDGCKSLKEDQARGSKRARRRVCLALAEGSAREALRLDPNNAFTLGLLASIRHDLGHVAESICLAREGLRLEPENPRCLMIQAIALRGGRIDEAIEASSRLVAIREQTPHQHTVHARNLLMAGRRDEAMFHIQEAMRLNPHLPLARAALLEGLRAAHRWYRPFRSQTEQLPRKRTVRLWMGFALLLIITLPVVVYMICTHLHLDPELRLDFTALSEIPGMSMVGVRHWVNFAVQFDPRSREALTADQRRIAIVFMISFWVLAMVCGRDILSRLVSPAIAGVYLALCLILAVFVAIVLVVRGGRRSTAAAESWKA